MLIDNLPPDATGLTAITESVLDPILKKFAVRLVPRFSLLLPWLTVLTVPSAVLVSLPFLHSAGVLLPRAFVLEAPSAWNALSLNLCMA